MTEAVTNLIAPPPKPAPLHPPQSCPHGGIYIGGIAICGECSKASQEDIWGLVVLYVAKMAAKRAYVSANNFEDDIGTAALSLVGTKNRKAIMGADNPTGMAITIAKRAIQKSYRSPNVKEKDWTAVGTMNWKSEEGGEASVTERLEFFQAPIALSQHAAAWSNACYERIREIPCVHLLWTDANFRKLQIIIEESIKHLPTTPFSWWTVIDGRLAYTKMVQEVEGSEAPIIKGWSWAAIAKYLDITQSQARYAYSQGLAMMKVYIVNNLMPEKILNPAKSAE